MDVNESLTDEQTLCCRYKSVNKINSSDRDQEDSDSVSK